jgi:hypothetical protein
MFVSETGDQRKRSCCRVEGTGIWDRELLDDHGGETLAPEAATDASTSALARLTKTSVLTLALSQPCILPVSKLMLLFIFYLYLIIHLIYF